MSYKMTLKYRMLSNLLITKSSRSLFKTLIYLLGWLWFNRLGYSLGFTFEDSRSFLSRTSARQILLLRQYACPSNRGCIKNWKSTLFNLSIWNDWLLDDLAFLLWSNLLSNILVCFRCSLKWFLLGRCLILISGFC